MAFNFNDFFFGGQTQANPEYTAGQVEGANAAWGNAAGALQGLTPQSADLSAFTNYINGLDPSSVFNNVMSPEAQAQYGNMVQAMTSGASGSMMDAAKIQSQNAANAAAEGFNLGGPGGLFSGAAASGIAQGAAAPIADAQSQIAQMQAQAYQNLIGQNFNSQNTMMGLEAQGQGTLAGLGAQDTWNANNIDAQKAAALAQIYGNQAGSYDTAVTYEKTPGLFDYANSFANLFSDAGKGWSNFATGFNIG